MNDDEIELFNKQWKSAEIEDAFKLAAGITEETLKQIQSDLDRFIKNPKEQKEEKKSKDINPFTALFSSSKKNEEKKVIESAEDIKPDNYYERLIRELAMEKSRDVCYNIYDIYKKSHDMASHQDPPDEYFNREVEPIKK